MKNVFTFGFVGLEAITGVVLAILLLFLNVEKNISKGSRRKSRPGGRNGK